MIVSAIGWNDVALESGDAALRTARESRYADILVPMARGARGMAMSGARRYEAAVEELDAATQLPEGHADDYDFLIRFAVTGVVCNHLLGHFDVAQAASNQLAQRYGHAPPSLDSTMVTYARVVATCPFDPEAAGELLYRHLEQARDRRHVGFDRHALAMLALVDLYRGDEPSAAESLALCDGPFDVLTPLVWEYRRRVEGWPSDEFDQRRLASVTAFVADPPRFALASERVDALLGRRLTAPTTSGARRADRRSDGSNGP